jgi:uncharacterized protein (TIGR02246 family)
MPSSHLDPQHPGLQRHDVVGPVADATARPTLGSGHAADQEAMDAVAGLVEELQAGWDEHDADVTDRSLAADVMWGSPFGATVQGYEELHAIHIRLKERGMGGTSSRFEVVQILAPTSDVVLAQVRRAALDSDGQAMTPSADLSGPFSEMALYVLIRRHGAWWVAAGQNTPLGPPPD